MSTTDKYTTAVKYILIEQESIIGPVARELAKQIDGIKLSEKEVELTTDPKNSLSLLVEQFHTIFGQLSIEVSKKAIKAKGLVFEAGELPEILK